MSVSAIFARAPAPGKILARDLATGDLVILDPDTLVSLAGVGELARAGQCAPGERGWTVMGRLVVIVRRAIRGMA